MLLPLTAARSTSAADGTYRAYVGTYTGAKSEGIYTFEFNAKTGSATKAELAAKTENPSFVAVHPSGKWLYAVSEISEFRGEQAGAISAFAIDASSGKLTLLNQQSAKGTVTCHLVVDKGGRFVLAANYGSGSVCSLPIKDDGSLGQAVSFIQHTGSGVNRQRQEGPHAHSINLDAANRFAVAADLGVDKVFVYRFDSETGKLTPNAPPFAKVAPGSGPRHFAFHPSGKYGYVINEMLLTVTAFDYDASQGTLQETQTISTLPGPAERGYSTAEVVAHPSGKFLYGSNRGHHSIAIFTIDQSTGRLTAVGHESTRGETPRNFVIDPSGTWLFAENQGTDTIVVFRIDPETGGLSATDMVIDVPSPVCVRMMPTP
jgi:6-phosphogluconolactonase